MSDESVQELFSRTAAEFGPETAIERGQRRITYAELEADSNRLANFLLEGGAGKGTMVGLFTDDPTLIISGILGVLKAGAVFVPLDPTFPEGRLQVMSERVEPHWYVSEAKRLEKLNQLGHAEARIVCLDDEAYLSYQHAEHPGVPSDPEAPCSIYFTSGSTGKPKAILGRLKGIAHFMRWEIEAVGAGPGTRVSQLASPSFDGFLKDAFVPLCSGGVVCARESRELLLDAGRLVAWLNEARVAVLHCVPSLFRALLNERLASSDFAALQSVVLTGEPLYPADVKRWMEVFGTRVRLFNIYGTTETTLSKFAYEVKPEDVERPSIPVGKPIDGSNVLVIDSRGELCGLGAVGEINIRSPYRSHGYYGEPELTREVFIQNPLTGDPDDLVHKTGDYGRILKGGDLEHLGRRDQQVQIRGVRVELGEIENLLRAHEAVGDVAVVDREDRDGNKLLVAYVTMKNGTGSSALRAYLAQQVPETMLPSAFVELEQLPRTLNGKIDRKALPTLESLNREVEKDGVQLSPIEQIVAGIWSDVLRLPAVGRQGNFFNLGGHSLLVTQVLARVREHLKVELPVRSLFEAPTVEEFARLLEEQLSEGRATEPRSIARVSREGELPLSYAQHRMWFFEQLSQGTSAFNIACGVRIKGFLNVAALEQTFGEIMRRHEGLRAVFVEVNGAPRQVIQPPRPFQLTLTDLSALGAAEPEAQAARLAQEETVRKFELERGPLARPTLLKLSEQEHIVICTLCHIAADAQSFEVVIAEMSQLYTAMRKGEPSPLSELTVQYVDYAAWQQQWLQGDELERRLAYWRRQLADAPEQLNLPLSHPRPKVQAFGGATHELNLSPQVTAALREVSRREGMTLFMTMLSAFVVLLNQYTDDEDIIVGTIYANRERVEAEKLIGIIANTIVLRVDLSGATTFREVMRRVRQVCVDAYTHQVSPELLREDFAKRGEERERLFDVWFQLDRQLQQKFEMHGLESSVYGEAKEVPRFELSMTFGEQEEDMMGKVDYDYRIFDAGTIEQMVEDYRQLLQLVTADPEKNLATISLGNAAAVASFELQ